MTLTLKKSGINFDKPFFKLVNESVCGKTKENLRKRVDVSLETNVKNYQKLVAKSYFISKKEFRTNLIGAHKNQKRIDA